MVLSEAVGGWAVAAEACDISITTVQGDDAGEISISVVSLLALGSGGA
jgi:hypothetical protein